MSMPSSLIRKYVSKNVSKKDLYNAINKWIKRYWQSLSATERRQLRIDLENNRPIFAEMLVRERLSDGSVFLDWSKPTKRIDRKKHGKSISWKRYCLPSIIKKKVIR